MMTDSEALSIAAIVIAILRRDGYISHHRRESVRGKEGPPGLPGLPGLAGAPGKDGKKGDKGDKGDRGDSTPYLPSPWRIYVDFSSTNPMEDGTEHNPYHSMAPAMNKWKTLGGIPAHVLVGGGQSGAVYAPVVVPDGCTGCIEGLDSATPTIGPVSIAAGNSSGSGQVVLRHLGTGAITIRDRVGAVAGDLGIVVLDSVTVMGGISSQNGLHSALVLASGTSQVTPTNLSPSMVLEGGPLNLRSGLLIADNARISGGLECGAFQISGCFYVGTLNLKAPFPHYSRFLRTEFLDPFTIDADAAADVWFDAQSAERFGLISADCTTNVTALSNGFGPMLRRLSAAVNAFDPVRATAALTAGPAAGVPDNDVIGICYPGRLQDQIALIWPSGTQVPSQPGASGTYYRDDATGTATKTPPVGSQRLFHCDGSVCAVGLSYQESV